MSNDPQDLADEEPLPLPSTTIKTIASRDYLESIWKRFIRPALRRNRFSDFYLAADAVQYAAYEWGLVPFLERLGSEILDGSYSPESADIIRGAKARGLSRPLAFLSPRDALIYHAIVARALPDLVKELRPWTGATQKHKETMPVPVPMDHTLEKEPNVAGTGDLFEDVLEEWVEDVVETDYGNFFQRWLQKQGVVDSILEQTSFVIESDVSNYFSSIDLGIAQEYLLRTNLHRDVVRLLIHLVRNVLRHPQYAESPSLGLPQEQIDSSRHIAHGLLVEVDREFDALGEVGRYGRFMDDFVAGAPSIPDAEKIIARLQARLEPLGLYPNPAKTRIFEVQEYRQRIMASENAYLDAVESSLVEVQSEGLRSRSLPNADDLTNLVERANELRETQDRPAKWDRVLRRYYRYLRELGVGDWLPMCVQDIGEHPDSAAHVLEYVRSFPISVSLATDLLDEAHGGLELYGNIPLFILEAIATAPTSTDMTLGASVMDRIVPLTQDILDRGVVPRSQKDWLLAYLAPLVAKFGTADQQMGWLEQLALPSHPVQTAVRLHVLPIQASLGIPSSSVFVSEMAGLSWSSVLTLDFIRALEGGDAKARGVAIGLIGPAPRLLPNRFQMHSRALSLMRIAATQPDKNLQKSLERASEKLGRNPDHLRDQVTISNVEATLAEIA